MSPVDAFTLHLGKDGKVERVSAEERSFKPIRLHPTWCRCPEPSFHSYPGDGECSCGTHKHHVHCANCGAISQVG